MKRGLLLVCFLFASILSYSQLHSVRANKVTAEQNLLIPVRDTTFTPERIGELVMRPIDTAIYTSISRTAPHKWEKIGGSGSGGGVDSVVFIPSEFIDSVYYYIGTDKYLAGIIDRKSGLIRPGNVNWDSLLVFSVSPAIYRIDGVRYTSNQTNLTLDPADPTNPRIDIIALDATGVIKITGTPSANPAAPQVLPNQIMLTSVLVPAGSTTPGGVASTTIYDENIEWTTSATGVTANFDNTTNSFHSTKSGDIGAFTNGQSIKFTTGSPLDITPYSVLKLYIRLKATFNPNTQLQLAWMNGTSVVSSTINLATGSYGYDRTITGAYQPITIPVEDWDFTSSVVNSLRIMLSNSNGSGFYIDYIRVQSGIIQVQGQPQQVNITGDEGVSVVNGTNVKLGSTTATTGVPFLQNRYVNTGNFTWFLTGTSNDALLSATSSGNDATVISGIGVGANTQGVYGGSNNGTGVQGFGGTYGVFGHTFNGIGVRAVSNGSGSGLPGEFTNQHNTTNTVLPAARFYRTTTGTAGTGIGVSLEFYSETNDALFNLTNSFESKFTNVSPLTRVSKLSVMGVNNAATGEIANFDGTGVVGIGINSAYTGTRLHVADNALAAGSMVAFTSTNTTAASNLQKLFLVSNNGANATASQITYSAFIENNHTGSSSTNYAIWGVATNGTANTGVAGTGSSHGVRGISTTGTGTKGEATSGTGVEGTASTGKAIVGVATGSNVVADFNKFGSVTNTTVPVLAVNASSTGTTSAGFGPIIDMYSEASDNSNPLSFSLRNPARDVSAGGWTTAADFWLMHNNLTVKRLTLEGDGRVTLNARLLKLQGVDVASVAGAIAVGFDGNSFEITGTNAITALSNVGWQNGSEVTLLFTSTASLTDGVANSGTDIGFELNGNTNFTGSAGSTITLLLSEIGSVQRWREKARSVN